MREIEFRGLRVDGGGWVYGYLESSKFIIDRLGYSHNVCWKTVGQFTGLRDENEDKIYEGDLIDGKVVSFSLENATFILGSEPLFLSHNHREIEGNIHVK